ncbi:MULTISPECIES: LutC/YkgG family protein [Mycolicibacterium]|uniref:LutC/YkgG family protein n=1 Tax=Mycolicibacterium TaxID=1866885 RepID=UPI000FA3E71B|nr:MULTISPECIES: lactate utilization protein C [Mycolicibacterium]RUP27896.1 MAG: lactate utilization protein C [Mycolicibacterium sp.]UCZ63184.1 lactate utilization protein C [Mycolicibacterium phocaicum]
MSDARTEVLGRIRTALGPATTAIEVPREYDREPLSGSGDVDRFAETVADYRAQVHRVDASQVAATIAALIGAGTAVAPADLPPGWVAGIRAVVDDPPVGLHVLDSVDAVVTGCALGIAATGTIVLDAGAAQGRRALTLVPNHHVCVIRADQIVDTVPQAFAALDPSRPLTFISGPSATSDIELQRVEGVHGPRILDVVIVEDGR